MVNSKIDVALDKHLLEQLKAVSEENKCSLQESLDAAVVAYIHKQATRPISTQAVFQPQLHLREAKLDPANAALLFIDIQNFNCHPSGALYSNKKKDTEQVYWWSRMRDAEIGWKRLQSQCRKSGVEVMYTVMESLTNNGRDRSLDYKISGFHVPKGSWDGQVLESIRPLDDEIVIPKTSSSVFTTTNIDILLRNLEKKQLILAGCLTDQCVESAVRDACDLNYLVTLVTDACCTYSCARHQNSIEAVKGYCRQRTIQEVLQELKGEGK